MSSQEVRPPGSVFVVLLAAGSPGGSPPELLEAHPPRLLLKHPLTGAPGYPCPHGAPWCPMVPHGAPWCPMVPHGAPWCPAGLPWR